jgi:ABC-type glutathione transport system ATPase component
MGSDPGIHTFPDLLVELKTSAEDQKHGGVSDRKDIVDSVSHEPQRPHNTNLPFVDTHRHYRTPPHQPLNVLNPKGASMQRVMIVGQPGSGKSTLARKLDQRTDLPVIHIDTIHWQPGWEERSGDEKTRLCHEVQTRDV